MYAVKGKREEYSNESLAIRTIEYHFRKCFNKTRGKEQKRNSDRLNSEIIKVGESRVLIYNYIYNDEFFFSPSKTNILQSRVLSKQDDESTRKRVCVRIFIFCSIKSRCFLLYSSCYILRFDGVDLCGRS